MLGFQVSYIYSLAVFEDYLYATHSDPSKGSSSVELLQIHRFNITTESKTLASLGNTRRLRVYHKLTQPKGKEHFPHRLAWASMCHESSSSSNSNAEVSFSTDKRILLWFRISDCSFVICPQPGVMHVKQFHMESREDVPISAFWVAATSPEHAAVVLVTAWTQMDSPVKVSKFFALIVNMCVIVYYSKCYSYSAGTVITSVFCCKESWCKPDRDICIISPFDIDMGV